MMQNVFTTFASSRFINQAAVIEILRRQVNQLKMEQPNVVAVYLFGSFAAGKATPRSDADVAIEIDPATPELRRQVEQAAFNLFLESPVPVDLVILSSSQLAAGQESPTGLAGCILKTGQRLE